MGALCRGCIPLKTAKAFAIGDDVVYPGSGVGTISREETLSVDGAEQRFHVIAMREGRVTLRVPFGRPDLRPLSTDAVVAKAMAVIAERPRKLVGIWSRRGREYEQRIASGGLIQIAQALRDLNVIGRGDVASYSERTLHDVAIRRLVDEIAAVRGGDPVAVEAEVIAALRDGGAKARAAGSDAGDGDGGEPS